MATEVFSSIQKAWNKVDGNNDGSVDYQEFVSFMNSDTVAEKMGGECIDMPTWVLKNRGEHGCKNMSLKKDELC